MAVGHAQLPGPGLRGGAGQAGDEGHGKAAALEVHDPGAVPHVEGLGVVGTAVEMQPTVREDAIHIGADESDLPGAFQQGGGHGSSLP